MDLSKLTLSDRIIAASGIVFLIFSFLPWYGKDYSVGTFSGSYSENGWSYFLFGIIPALLAIAILAYIAIRVFSPSTNLPELPVPWATAVLIAAAVAAVLVVLKLLIGASKGGINLDRKYGLFIAVLAVLGLVAGAAMAFMAEQKGTTSGGTGSTPPTPF